ncbi:hypothetical protein ACWGMA_33995 [Streptomyces asiaticus]
MTILPRAPGQVLVRLERVLEAVDHADDRIQALLLDPGVHLQEGTAVADRDAADGAVAAGQGQDPGQGAAGTEKALKLAYDIKTRHESCRCSLRASTLPTELKLVQFLYARSGAGSS